MRRDKGWNSVVVEGQRAEAVRFEPHAFWLCTLTSVVHARANASPPHQTYAQRDDDLNATNARHYRAPAPANCSDYGGERELARDSNA